MREQQCKVGEVMLNLMFLFCVSSPPTCNMVVGKVAFYFLPKLPYNDSVRFIHGFAKWLLQTLLFWILYKVLAYLIFFDILALCKQGQSVWKTWQYTIICVHLLSCKLNVYNILVCFLCHNMIIQN